MDAQGIIGFLIGIVGSLLANIIYSNWDKYIPISKKITDIDLQGFWVGTVDNKGAYSGPHINLYKIKVKENKIIAHMEHYRNGTKIVALLHGIGMYSQPQVVLAYKFGGNNAIQCGTFIARVINENGVVKLAAVFSQYREIDKNGKKLIKLHSENYTLEKVDISLPRQIGKIFGKTYFSDYEEASAQLNLPK